MVVVKALNSITVIQMGCEIATDVSQWLMLHRTQAVWISCVEWPECVGLYSPEKLFDSQSHMVETLSKPANQRLVVTSALGEKRTNRF